jgi:hypothetical protein
LPTVPFQQRPSCVMVYAGCLGEGGTAILQHAPCDSSSLPRWHLLWAHRHLGQRRLSPLEFPDWCGVLPVPHWYHSHSPVSTEWLITALLCRFTWRFGQCVTTGHKLAGSGLACSLAQRSSPLSSLTSRSYILPRVPPDLLVACLSLRRARQSPGRAPHTIYCSEG